MGLDAVAYIAIASLVVTAAGTGYTIYEQQEQAKDAAKQRKERFRNEEANRERQRRELLGAQAAMGGASGIDPSSGSSARLALATERQFDIESGLASYNARKERGNIKRQGTASLVSGIAEGAGTSLSGIAGQYQEHKRRNS